MSGNDIFKKNRAWQYLKWWKQILFGNFSYWRRDLVTNGPQFCIQCGQQRVDSQGTVWGLIDRNLLSRDIKAILIQSTQKDSKGRPGLWDITLAILRSEKFWTDIEGGQISRVEDSACMTLVGFFSKIEPCRDQHRSPKAEVYWRGYLRGAWHS